MVRAPFIMIIRHAEKPTSKMYGVEMTGHKNRHDLIVRGWQRAGALISLFAPGEIAAQASRLPIPAYLFASSTNARHSKSGSKSHRERQTLLPLAQKFALEIDLTYDRGDEAELAAAAVKRDGPVLIAWQHDKIPKLARCIPGKEEVPAKWPRSRFDLVYVFQLEQGSDTYRFIQVPQLLLAGDSSSVNPI